MKPIPVLVSPKYDIGDVIRFEGQPSNNNYIVFSTSQIQYAGDMPRISYGVISENFVTSKFENDFEIMDQNIMRFIRGADENTLALASKYVNEYTETEDHPPFIEHTEDK